MPRKKRIVDGVDGWPVTKHDCLGNKGAKWWVCECPKCKKHYKRFLFWKGNAKVPPIYCPKCKYQLFEEKHEGGEDDTQLPRPANEDSIIYPLHSREAQRLIDKEVFSAWQINQSEDQ